MSVRPNHRARIWRRFGGLAVLVALQAFGVLFFIGDVTADIIALGFDPHTSYEAFATFALMCGVVWGGFEMTGLLRQMRRNEYALKMASGAFSDLVNDRFSDWNLTPSEAEVALLTLKGFDAPEIAGFRGTAKGTVRAQLGSIYAKSGTNGRGQFVSQFIDALLDDAILPENTDTDPRSWFGQGKGADQDLAIATAEPADTKNRA